MPLYPDDVYSYYDEGDTGTPGLPTGPAAPVPGPTPAPAPSGGMGGWTLPLYPQANNNSGRQGNGNGGGDNYPGMDGPSYRFAPVPKFDAGDPFAPPEFHAPSLKDAQNEPGYQFRAQAGNDALQRSAAARGVLRTGGTLQDLVEYGQNFASQEYGQTFNRAMSAYDRDYQAKSGAYDRQYQGRRDAYAPRLAQWQALTSAEQARAMAAYNRQWDAYSLNHRGGGGGGQQMIPPPPQSPGGLPPGAPATPTGPDQPGPGNNKNDPYASFNSWNVF